MAHTTTHKTQYNFAHDIKRIAKMLFGEQILETEESEEVNWGNVPIYTDIDGQSVVMPQSMLYLDRVHPDYLDYASHTLGRALAQLDTMGHDNEIALMDFSYASLRFYNNISLMNIREYTACTILKPITEDDWISANEDMISVNLYSELPPRKRGRLVIHS
jgi:hypothetical protein